MVICCVKGCNNKQRTYTNIMFHRIPKPVERRNLWLAALGIPATTPVDKINQYRVCDEHFKPEDYEEKMQYATRKVLLHLKDTAVPSIFSTEAEQSSSSMPTSKIYKTTDTQMDAAVLVEEESASVGAVDHTNYTQSTQSSSSSDLSDLGQKEDCEKPQHESQEAEVRDLDERDYQVSHEEHEEKELESERISPQETDTKEEGMASNHENCGQELKEYENIAEEENNTIQEEEEENNTIQEEEEENNTIQEEEEENNTIQEEEEENNTIQEEEEENNTIQEEEEENNTTQEEEENNTTQEEEEETVPQVTSDPSLQQEPDGDLKEETPEPECSELSQQDKKLDENIIDDKKSEEKEVDEKNMEEMEHQMVKESSDMKVEMEHESSEQYQEPKVTEVKEENKQDGLAGTVVPEVEEVKSDSSAAMDVSYREEQMQVADPEDAECFVNVVSVEAKAESPFDEQHFELVSKSSPQDSSKNENETENHANQDLKDWAKELPAQISGQSVHPEMEAEKKMTPPTSGSPLVKIKDEPMDEEYEKALGSQAPTGKIKDEPDTSEEFGQKTSEQIKISAVFSVGGSSTAVGSSSVPAAANAPSNTTVPNLTLSSATSLCVVCSGCKKILLKGQTAYQRKGCHQLYCSPRCLCSSTPNESSILIPNPKKSCHYCLKSIPNPKDVIVAPVDSTKAVKDFCSQKCFNAFNYKRDSANSALATKCSMCQKACTIRHEVNFMGSVHKLCSDACFHQFRASNKLSMNSCVTCGGYCYSSNGKSPSLLVDGTTKKFCSLNCVSAFKKKYTKVVPCTMCRAYRTITEMEENVNSEGNTELFCSSACVTAHKVQMVSSSGSALECNHCKKVLVPQYHLAMSDGTIRNFCSFTCVISFQDAFNKTKTQRNQLNVAPTLGTTQLKSAPTVQSGSAESSAPNSTQNPSVSKFSCVQCQRSFISRPELLEFKGKMYVFCDKACTDEFRRTHYIMAQCVYCKIEKVVKEVKRINNVDCSFCSEGCKLLYKHDLAKCWGKKHCRNCLYCNSTSQTVMTSIFSGKQEEFCGNECLSQYTLLFCEVAKCSMCKRARKMTESVKWLNEMKHFCNLKCLMYFCSQQSCTTAFPVTSAKPALTQASTVPISIAPVTHSSITNITTLPSLAPKEATPVIANVISLSNAPNGQPSVLGNAALQGTVPTVKLLGHASTQTDSVKPPSAPTRILKNKALLCKPMNQNKGTSCKPNTSDMNTQTDETPPQVIVLPLAVPVFVPVPMHLYTQYTPQPVGFPFPVPVPLFLPTTLDSAERIVETIQMIKERIPDNPLEADLIMMAEMVAEDSEKDKAVSQGDQDDNFIEDFDLEALSSHLSWEDDSISSASRWGRSSESEKVPPSGQAQQSPSPAPQEPQMDLEADFPVESFEHLEQRTQEDKSVTPTRLKTRKKNRDCFPQKKRARKRTETPPQSSAADVHHPSKLHTKYGVQAWKSWVRWMETQPKMEMPKFGSRNITIKEDVLQCSTAELSYGLCKFVSEVRRPNGETYSPDSIYYLCLGIQQHLFENGRMENIFTDLFYTKFTQTMSRLLTDWKPTILPSGYIHSRVEEEYLWECKQLGAFSPSVLLNTLLYFCTKFFDFKTVAQHRRLSFAHIMRCTRTHSNGSKMSCLRFYPPVHKENKNTSNEDDDGVPAKRKREDEEEEGVVLEMQENAENPLHCPVRLYEFYLSKCSSMVKQRTSVFYLRPERSCVPNSPLWFSHMSLDDEELGSMLTRILTVREIHLEREKPLNTSDPENQSDSE
ncbi:zinc finger MYM-type protein 4 isoform X2 [Neoarius graeffei]|uniref:zinc finger MYM-type protein 4 isoform X2 n=1 Tax=Neoarius graeffei TaxID=443677 RepID=UPI00298BFBCA|nr:zinc finger MYM-type protein 4 isoform X2 [Neoarius graeffei]